MLSRLTGIVGQLMSVMVIQVPVEGVPGQGLDHKRYMRVAKTPRSLSLMNTRCRRLRLGRESQAGKAALLMLTVATCEPHL